jgi:cytosine/adenosine deaminase-related metal-dependent hydrolase
VRPGLINAHDHLHRNHYGRLGAGPYPNAYRWAEDIQLRYRRRIARRRRLPRREALLAGAWKNLFAGATTVVHHDQWEPDFDRDFPIRVARIASADSLGLAKIVEPPATSPFCIHVAEGVDDVAADEVAELDRRGLLNRSLVAVHGVGIAEGEVERFAASGAALVWCPTSNQFLFNRTASGKLLDSGCDVLLGSDSRLTGAGDLLDEIRSARALRILDEERLADSVGRTCALRFGLAGPSLEPGSKADLMLITEPLTKARSSDVALVVVDGTPRVARQDIACRLGAVVEQGKKMRIGNVVRWANGQGGNG